MKAPPVSRTGRIAALQGLRACGFLAIFFSHSIDGFVSFGAAGVSVFLILSGFLLAYRYLPRESLLPSPNPRGNLHFAVQKIRGLYPLHLLTLVVTLIWMLLNQVQYAQALDWLPLKLFLNVFLLQSWVPKSDVYYSLNSVSWYLSTALFTYFLFPWLLHYLRRLSGRKQAFRALLLLAGLEGLLSVLFGIWGSHDSAAWLSLHWITYVCPLFRALDFSVGVFAGYLFLVVQSGNAPTGKRVCLATACETLLVFILLAFCRLYSRIPDQFRYSLVYLVPTTLLIVSLAGNVSLFSRMLSWKPFQWVGNLSGPAFLIHMPVLRVGVALRASLLHSWPWYCFVSLLLTITLLLAFLWSMLQKKLSKTPAGQQA